MEPTPEVFDIFAGIDLMVSKFPDSALDVVRNIGRVRTITTSGDYGDEPLEREDVLLFRLKGLLPMVRWANSTDPRDKVFGLLSLASETADRLPKADYSCTVQELYILTVRYWLHSEQESDLTFLNHVQSSKAEHQLPYWTPNWSSPLTTAPLVSIQDYKFIHTSYRTTNFRAASLSAASAQILSKFSTENTSSLNLLTLKGVNLTTIDGIENDQTRGMVYDLIIGYMRKQQTYPTTTESYAYAFQAMMGLKEPNPHFRRQRFWDLVKRGQEGFKTGEYQPISLKEEVFDLNQFKKLVKQSDNRYYVTSSVFKRSFFISDSGFMGLAPLSAEPGDVVCIFLGGCTPFVIREIEDHYKFIRECFVYGIMQGEVMKDLPEEKVTDIELR